MSRRWPAEDVERLRRMKALGGVLTPRLEALLAMAGGAAGAEDHGGQCRCESCGGERDLDYRRGHGYGAGVVVVKNGRRYRARRDTHPADVPGAAECDDVWERA
jgi:hypothetical protein